MSVTTRRYHARELERRTRIRALEGQAQLLLNDLNEYGTWLEWSESRAIPADEVAERWLRDVYRPTLARIAAVGRPGPRPRPGLLRRPRGEVVLSEREGRDVGLSRAIDAYLELGAPAPETIRRDDDLTRVLDPLELDPLELDPAGLDATASDAESAIRSAAAPATAAGGGPGDVAPSES